MITNSPYGFGYGRKGCRVGTEPEPVPVVQIRKPEPQEVIDRCLNCTKEVCYGNCEFTPEGKSYSKYKLKQTKLHQERQKQAEELDRQETEQAAQVAEMYLIGWCERAIARELGLSEEEVDRRIKLGRKKGLLY